MIQSFIFSKDRPCQLDLFLRTMKTCWREYGKHKFIVNYDFSDEDYLAGYGKVKKYHPDIIFDKRNDFKTQFINSIDDSIPYMTFFTDDNIFTRRFNPDDIEDTFTPTLLCFSMALGININFHPELGLIGLPDFDSGNYWPWKEASVDFGFPMALTGGHVFRTPEIKSVLQASDINDVPDIEPKISACPIDKPLMCCFDYSVVFENAINMIQDQHDNFHGDVKAETLNRRFLRGQRMVDIYHKLNNNSIHEIQKVKMA